MPAGTLILVVKGVKLREATGLLISDFGVSTTAADTRRGVLSSDVCGWLCFIKPSKDPVSQVSPGFKISFLYLPMDLQCHIKHTPCSPVSKLTNLRILRANHPPLNLQCESVRSLQAQEIGRCQCNLPQHHFSPIAATSSFLLPPSFKAFFFFSILFLSIYLSIIYMCISKCNPRSGVNVRE